MGGLRVDSPDTGEDLRRSGLFGALLLGDARVGIAAGSACSATASERASLGQRGAEPAGPRRRQSEARRAREF